MSAAEPLLIPHADADGSLCGYLRVCERDFSLRIVPACPPTPARLDGCGALRSTLAGHEAALQQWLRSCTSPDEFLVELRDLLERLLRAQPAPAPLTTSSFYEQVMSELDGIGWSALRNISPSFDRLELELLDQAQRAHVLHLSLPPDYPASPPRAEAALPAPFELQWAAEQQRFSVRGAMLQFEAALGRHQLLWDMLDDLDAHTWVLEPHHPTRDVVVRRLAIGQHCSLQLGLHVGAPASLPALQFLGAEKSLAGYRSALNARLAHWRPERSVRLNLEAVLDLKFPSPQEACSDGAEEYSVECAVCYMYELDGCVPEIACDGCSKPFHKACLYEWLSALPSTRSSFNRLFGECPYCSRPVTVEAS